MLIYQLCHAWAAASASSLCFLIKEDSVSILATSIPIPVMRVPTPTARAVHGLFNAFKIVCFAICRSIPLHTDEIPFASKFTAVLVPSIALDAFLYVRKAVTTAPTAGANHLKFFQYSF